MLLSRHSFKTMVTVLIVALLTGMPALQAHDDSMPGKGKVPGHARDNMRAFHDDHHHNEHLAAQSITTCVGGMAGGYPCSNVDLMAFLPLAQIGGGNGNDIWGWTDPLNGKEYAIMGLTNGTAFVDISDPVNPVYLGHLPPPGGVANSSWRDIKVYSNHAFIGSEAVNSGLQVMDLTQLRSVVAPPVTFVETHHSTPFSRSHNVVINEDSGFLYAVGANTCGGGLVAVDISTPASPVLAGCFSADGYTHDAQCVNYNGPDATYTGREICFAYNEDTLTIVDVTNKSAPVQVSRTGYLGSEYSHQGWVTEDHSFVLLDDELDESRGTTSNTRTLIWDVSDLDAPVYTGDYLGPSTAIDHNQYIVGDRVYQANYRSGLRILDISDIAIGSLVEVGFFDIFPSSDSPNFNGAWSVYPFFDSGNVIVSGIEQGLYILRPNQATPNAPPSATILEPSDGAPGLSGNVLIRIDAADAEDAAGTLNVEWNVNGGGWQSAAWDGLEYTATWDSTTVLDGAHTLNARAIDSALAEGSDSITVNTANGSPEFTVDAVNVSIDNGKGNRNQGLATIMVSDGSSPLDGVAISGSFSGGWSGERSGTSDGNGEVSVNTPRVKNLSFVQFCVESASKAGWTFNAAGSTLCGDSNGGGSAFGSVGGNVSDDVTAAGIPNAAVSTDTGQSANTDSFGDYLITDVPVGNRTVSVTASGYQSANASTTVNEGAMSIVDFALTETATGGSGSIKGTVQPQGGGKLSGVTVQVVGGTSSQTNNGGKYNIQNVPAGLQTVTASKPGYMSQQQQVNVQAGGTVTLDFTLAPNP